MLAIEYPDAWLEHLPIYEAVSVDMPIADIAVVIPTFNSESTLARCLASIFAGEIHPREVVVVDDPRTSDSTRDIADTYRANVIVSPAPFAQPVRDGRAQSRNIGVCATISPIVLSLDSDMSLEPGLIQSILGVFDSNTDGATIAETAVGTGYWARGRAIDKKAVERTGYGRSLRLFTRRLFETLGGFDASLVAGEDADFHIRALDAGARLKHLESPGIIHHEGSLTLRTAARKKYRYGQTAPAFEAKHGDALLTGYITRILVGTRVALRDDPLAVPAFFALKATESVAGLLGRSRAKLIRAPAKPH